MAWKIPKYGGEQESWRAGGQPTGETWRGNRQGTGQNLAPYDGPRVNTALKNAYAESLKQRRLDDPIQPEWTPRPAQPAPQDTGTPWQARLGGSIGLSLVPGMVLGPVIGALNPRAAAGVVGQFAKGNIKQAYKKAWKADWWRW